MDNTLEVSKAS